MATSKSNVLEILKQDHRKVAEIFKELETTTNRAIKKREELLLKLKKELSLHEHVEETVFYPSVKNSPKTKDLVLEAYEEHHLIDNIFDDLAQVDVDDETWKAKLTVLKENVEHHVHEEEHDLFPKVKELLDIEELKNMGEKVIVLKEEVSM